MLSKRKITGGVLAVVGYMLSPLSWWNDAVVNFPLALAFAWLVSSFYKPAFEVCLIVGYWLTNILGLVLMHKGAQNMLSDQKKPARVAWLQYLAISLLYTGVIVLLLELGVLRPIQNYFQPR